MAAPRLFLFLALVIVVSAGGKDKTPDYKVVREPERQLECVKVTLNSDDHQTVYDKNHKPVKIKSVTVVHQTSHVKCREHVNYFFHGSELSTKHGCCATFKVCYKVTVCKTKCKPPPKPPKCKSKDKSCKKPRKPKTKKCTKCSRRIRYTKVSKSTRRYETPEKSKKYKKGSKSRSKDSKIKIKSGCKEVKLLSRVNRPVFRTVVGGDFKSIKLIKEYHDSQGCSYGHTYGCKDGHEIFVKKGCRGLFKVCVS